MDMTRSWPEKCRVSGSGPPNAIAYAYSHGTFSRSTLRRYDSWVAQENHTVTVFKFELVSNEGRCDGKAPSRLLRYRQINTVTKERKGNSIPGLDSVNVIIGSFYCVQVTVPASLNGNVQRHLSVDTKMCRGDRFIQHAPTLTSACNGTYPRRGNQLVDEGKIVTSLHGSARKPYGLQICTSEQTKVGAMYSSEYPPCMDYSHVFFTGKNGSVGSRRAIFKYHKRASETGLGIQMRG
jgi:hypothetical protein